MGSETSDVVNAEGYGLVAYAELISLLFFSVGFLRGRITGRVNSGVSITGIACLIVALVAFILNSACSLVISTSFLSIFGESEDSKLGGVLWGVCGAGLILLQMLIVIPGAAAGGFIGSRFPRRKPHPA